MIMLKKQENYIPGHRVDIIAFQQLPAQVTV